MASPNGIMRPTTSLSLAFLLGLALTQTNIAASEPGYLDFDNLPETNFSCKGKVIGGYYADVETGCQMFHVCTIGQKGEITDIKFLCLNGTVFDQETRVCERIDEVDCARSESFFGLNLELYGNQPASLGIAPEETECSEDCTTISSIDYSDEAESTTSPLVVIATSTTTPLPSPQTTTPITPQRPRTTQRLRLTTSETTPSAPLSGDSHQALATLLALHNVYSQPQPPPQPPSPSAINSAFAPPSPDGHLHEAHEAFGGGESTHEPPLKQYNTFRERPQPADYVHGYPRHHFPLTSSQKPPSANYHHFENSDTHFTHTFETGRPFEFHFVKQGSTTTSTPTPQFASEEVGDTLPQPAAISVVTSTSSSTSIKTSGKVRTSFFHPNSTGVPTGYEEYREGDTDPFFHDVPKILRPGRRRRSDRIRTKRNVRGDSKCTSKTEFLQNLLGSIDILQDERQKLFNFFKESEPEMGEDFKRMDTSGFLKVLENKIGSVNLGSNPQLRRMDTEVEEDTSGTKRPKRQVSKYEHGQRQAADKMEVEQRNSGVILRELLNTIVSNQESEKNLQEESASEEPNEGFNIKPQWDPILKGDISIYFPVDVPEGLTSRVHRVNSHGKGQEDSTSEPGVVLLRQFERSMEDFTQKDNKYFSSEHELILKTVNIKNGTQSATNIRKVTNNYSSDPVDKQQHRHLEGGVTKPFVEFSDRSKGAVGDDFKRADIEEHGSIARVDYDLEEVEGKRLNRGQGEVTKQLQASRLQNSILKQSGVGGGMQLDAVLKPRVEYDQEVLKQVSTFFTVLENRIKADLLRQEESRAPKNREILQVQNYKTKQQDMKNTDLERIEARQNKQGNGVRTEANPEWEILKHIREFLAAFADAIKTQEGKENVEESLLLIGPGTNNAEGADSQSQQYSGRVNSGTFLESEKIRGRSDFTIGRLKGRTLDTVDYEDTGDISIEFPQDSITTTDSVGKHLSENEDLILIDDNLKAAEESKDIPGTLPESSQGKSNLGVLGPKIENLRRQNSSNELRDLPIEFDDFSRPLMEIGHDFLEADTPKFLGKKRTKRQVARRQNIDTEQFGAGRRKTDQRQPPKNQDSVKPVTEYVDEGEFTTVEYRQRGGAATVRPPPSKQPPPQQQARLKTRFDAYKETTILSGTKVMAESHPGTRRHTGLHSGTLRFPKNLATVRYQNLNQKNASERFVPVYEVPSEPSTESSNVKPIEMRPMSDEAPRRCQRTRGNVYIRKITSENGPQPPQFSSRKTAPQEQVTVPTIRKAYRQPLPPGSPKHHTSVPQPSESTPQSLSSSPSPRKVHHRQPPPTITPRPHAETSQSPTVTPRNLKLSQDLQPTTGPPRKVTVVRRRGTPPSRNRPPTTTEAPSTTPNLKPDPNFSCEGKVKGGFYADTNSDCRGFFICSQGEINGPLLKSHFWCGTATKFNQRSRTCQAETLVECSVSQRYYHLNDDFRVPETEEELLGGFEPTKVQ